MKDIDGIDWQALPLREAYIFGIKQGLETEVSSIRDMEIEWDLSYTSTLRRGFVVELFKEKGLLDAFMDACWPNGKTPDGERRIRRYLKVKRQYDDFLSSGQLSTGDVEELESDQEFAYESDLRDFVAKNLSVIEPGLSLYQDDVGTGIEYPIGNSGRVDILAKDKSGRLVVIELKVSQGRNRTIGQLLYYMGWVDANLSKSGGSRGIILAKEIPDDLRLACQRVPDVSLYKYTLSVATTKVYPST